MVESIYPIRRPMPNLASSVQWLMRPDTMRAPGIGSNLFSTVATTVPSEFILPRIVMAPRSIL